MDCRVFLVLLAYMVTKELLDPWVLLAPGVLLVLLALLAKMVDLDILDQSGLLAFVALRVAKVLLVPLVLLGLLGLLVSAEVAMTLVLKETSTGLTSLAHSLHSDPRTMKLMRL